DQGDSAGCGRQAGGNAFEKARHPVPGARRIPVHEEAGPRAVGNVERGHAHRLPAREVGAWVFVRVHVDHPVLVHGWSIGQNQEVENDPLDRTLAETSMTHRMPPPPTGNDTRFDWPALERSLDANGHGVLPRLLSVPQCERLAALYPRDDAYRSRIV